MTETAPYSAHPVKTISLEWPRVLVALTCILVTAWYLHWRFSTLNPESYLFSGIFLAAECFGVLTMSIHLFTVWRLTVRTPPAPPEQIGVDVFIATINEPVDTVRRTALASIAMDYPHTTYILDDGRRPEMRALAEELGCGYITRENNIGAKAGNLNNALDVTKGGGELIAFFDADHAPNKNFLLRTLGYFRDPKVAYVQTPQEFYNIDSYQHAFNPKSWRIWSDHNFFFRIIQRGKDAWNACFFCGSCAVMRRSALEEVGGFALGTAAEDLHTSVVLQKAGWSSVYHDEQLVFGVAPIQVDTYFKQRRRWGRSSLQIWRKEWVLFGRGFTFAQRILYLSSIITFFTGWQKFVFYLTPVVVMLTGILPFSAPPEVFFAHFIPFIAINWWTFAETGRGYGRAWFSERYNMANFAAYCWAVSGLIQTKIKFIVTSKQNSGAQQYWRFILPQLVIASVNIVVVVWAALCATGIIQTSLEMPAVIANGCWAAYTTFLALSVFSVAQSRRRFKRAEYRFNIPLVATFNAGAGMHYAAVDNLSGIGLRLRMAANPHLVRGAILNGYIHLPEGALPFTAEVRALHGTSVGCTFQWHDSAARNRLEQFLYGTDLEWRINNLRERANTPLSILLGKFVRFHDNKPSALSGQRQSMLYMPVMDGDDDAQARPGVVMYDDKTKRGNMLVFAPLPKGNNLETRIFTPAGQQTLRARVANENRLDHGATSLYWYQLEGTNA